MSGSGVGSVTNLNNLNTPLPRAKFRLKRRVLLSTRLFPCLHCPSFRSKSFISGQRDSQYKIKFVVSAHRMPYGTPNTIGAEAGGTVTSTSTASASPGNRQCSNRFFPPNICNYFPTITLLVDVDNAILDCIVHVNHCTSGCLAEASIVE